ncbi:MAG TPA: dephospho-CoA kinase [Methylophilaceae bacterium]|jgi:dephospho-CoA kinase|nr:dephospho-CoA kinase [Methylophilaceae bacterium]
MMIVGLTGGIGSGKSEAARLFNGLGVPVADTDAIAHALTAPGRPVLQEIAKSFGTEALHRDGSLNRAYLRQKVFSDAGAKHLLEDILHPLIREEVANIVARHASAPYQIVMVPLLFETGAYAGLIDRSLLIDCDESLQIARAMARSQLAETEVRAIMAAQCSREQRLEMADDVIVNNGTLADLEKQVREKHEKYIRLA